MNSIAGARRAPTVALLIRKHRLWPALEFVHDELVREFGSVRTEMTTSNPADEFQLVCFDAYLPAIEAEHVVELEEALSEQVTERFGRATSLRLLVNLHSDPNHLRRVSDPRHPAETKRLVSLK